ncbi:MAG: response regulator [Puniceicoccales bacterium]
MKSVYVIEDSPVLLDLLTTFIETEYDGLVLIGSTDNGMVAMDQCLKLKPDLVIADIHLPEVSGLEILHLLKMKLPEAKIIIFTGRTSSETLKIAQHGHADGFVSKASGLGELEKAIQSIQEGKQYFSRDLFGTFMGQ